ncbi:MAG: hypothetical protein OXC97_00260 [Candidatus Dadabacteria bacterium]|nr:hypothetical protein [Candidatus Dadabacteria bacterium]
MQSDLKAKLKKFLKENCILRDKQYTLASGESSDVYIDARIAILNPKGSSLITSIFFEEITKRNNIGAVGSSLSVGGSTLVGSIIAKSSTEERPLNGLIVRTNEKNYGTKNIVEGKFDNLCTSGHPPCCGLSVVMVEDIVNTGESILKAVDHLTKENINVSSVFSVVDRGKNTKEMFKQKGYEFFSIFTLDDLIS